VTGASGDSGGGDDAGGDHARCTRAAGDADPSGVPNAGSGSGLVGAANAPDDDAPNGGVDGAPKPEPDP